MSHCEDCGQRMVETCHVCYAADLEADFEAERKALRAERDAALARVSTLRAALVACCRNVGGLCEDSVSDEFLSHVPDEVRLVVEKLTARATAAEKRIAEAERERDNWKESSAQENRNCEYYRGLLDECAKYLGQEVFVQDDGGIVDHPLRSKIPELVADLAAKKCSAEKRAEEMRKVLRTLEWEGSELTYQDHEPLLKQRCPSCLGPKGRHEDHCALARALGGGK